MTEPTGRRGSSSSSNNSTLLESPKSHSGNDIEAGDHDAFEVQALHNTNSENNRRMQRVALGLSTINTNRGHSTHTYNRGTGSSVSDTDHQYTSGNMNYYDRATDVNDADNEKSATSHTSHIPTNYQSYIHPSPSPYQADKALYDIAITTQSYESSPCDSQSSFQSQIHSPSISTWPSSCKHGLVSSWLCRINQGNFRKCLAKARSYRAVKLVSVVTRRYRILVLMLLTLMLTGVCMVNIFSDSPSSRMGISTKADGALWNISSSIDSPFIEGCLDVEEEAKKPRANAALVVLARNSDLDGVLESMQSFERHFNRWFNYPYVFLNDERFDKEFRSRVRKATNAKVQFGVISERDWNFPEWASEEVVSSAIAKQGDRGIMYGNEQPYHRMCRFYSGKFYNHHLLRNYDWYWRIEPEIDYYCDITYDPFVYMEQHNKVYGYTIFIQEIRTTVPNLFRYTKSFKNQHNINTTGLWDAFTVTHSDLDKKELRAKRRAKQSAISKWFGGNSTSVDDFDNPKQSLEDKRREMLEEMPWQSSIEKYAIDGEDYNMCHFWSNFEIARLDFFRSKEYNDYFEALDRSQGFWNERWGDAPIHSLALGLFLEPKQLHYFRDIGYRHTDIQHCPANAPGKQLPYMPFERDTDEEKKFWGDIDPPRKGGVGCRCRCDNEFPDQETRGGSCLRQWADVIGAPPRPYGALAK